VRGSNVLFISRVSCTKLLIAKQEQSSVLFVPEGKIRPPGSMVGMVHLTREGKCVMIQAGWSGRNNNFQIFV